MAKAPTPPGLDAEVEDWHEYKQVYAGWVETATDEELVAEMVGLPVDGRPLSPSEAWRFHQCEIRRRRPSSKPRATKVKE